MSAAPVAIEQHRRFSPWLDQAHTCATGAHSIGTEESMLKSGADVNAIDKFGNSPLAYATKFNNGQVAQVLRVNGGK